MKEEKSVVDYQEFSDVIIKRLKEYSLATFERAFNDDRDGLRPLARRALYSMYEIHLDKDFKKVLTNPIFREPFIFINKDLLENNEVKSSNIFLRWFKKN